MTTFEGAISDPRGTLGGLAIAFAFLIFGSLVLAIDGPSLLAHPTAFPTLAVIHAFAAFIVLSIVAATHQLIPVVTGGRTLPAWVALAFGAPIAIGFALLVASFEGAGLFVPAGTLLAVGIGAWSLAMLARLIFASRELRLRIALAIAVAALLGAAAIGTQMALAFGGATSGGWLRLAPVHALLAIAGFASATIVAISYRLVPMFALSHTDDGLRRFLPALGVPALAVVAALCWFGPVWILRSMLAAVLVAFVAFIIIQAGVLRRRLRRVLDVSLRYAVVTWSFAILALLAALSATVAPSLAPVAVILAVLGWITPAILGYAYKIVGFLAWQRAKDRYPQAQLPPLSGAVDLRLSGFALLALTIGALGNAIAAVGPTLFGIPEILYYAGVLLSLAALARVIVRYRRISCNEPSTAAGSIHRSRWSASLPNSTR
ncbi:MAG: hypothetical protein ACRENA_03360 [Vulcanimicrobiaceae bacterium]